jgi:dihydrolipoamide dehydrogenase
MADHDFDLIVIGSGPGGYVAAIRASQLGLRVALIEKMKTLGGTCLNIGCIPAKALLDTTEFYSSIRDKAADHGIIASDLRFDLGRIMERKKTIVEKRVKGLAELVKANGIAIFGGTGRIVSQGKVSFVPDSGKEELLLAKNIIVATGSVPAAIPFIPFDGETVVSSDEALSFDKVPEELLVVGGGAIGLEMASVWSRLGAKTTVIELLPRLAPGTDEETAKGLARELTKQGIGIYTATKVTGYEAKGGKAVLACEDRDRKAVTFSGNKILVAVGRAAYIEGLGLPEAGIEFDPKTHKIKTDAGFRTNVPGIFAIGDVIDGPMLAHKAEEEGVACAEIIAGKPGHVSYGALPSVIYTWPELAGVGLSEEDCKAKSLPYNKGMFYFKVNGRGETSGNGTGFVKILAHAKTDRVLGAHILGPWASDLIGEIVSVIEFGGSSEDIARTIHAHPTFSEAVKEAAMDTEGWSVHSLPRRK